MEYEVRSHSWRSLILRNAWTTDVEHLRIFQVGRQNMTDRKLRQCALALHKIFLVPCNYSSAQVITIEPLIEFHAILKQPKIWAFGGVGIF